MTERKFDDGEIIGLDTDGCIIQWDADKGETYNCGETPEQFGLASIRPHEQRRIDGKPTE